MESVKMADIAKEAQLEQYPSLIQKLANIQQELKAPKNQFNKFGKYNYRNCEDILEAVKPLCFKHRVTLTVHDEVKYCEGRFYIEAVATLHDWDSGEGIVNRAFARESESKTGMDASQVTGASSSYARKYALNGLFCIDDTKDADTDAYKEQTQSRGTQQDQQEIQHLTKLWSDNRRRMDTLGIDYRSPEINDWICKAINAPNHDACNDVKRMRDINHAYDILIKRQLQLMDNHRMNHAEAGQA